MVKILLAFLIVSASSVAFSATHCACEIGQDKGQKSIFKLNCGIWLSRKKTCSTKKIIDRKNGTQLASYLPQPNKGDKLELGYVGNWSDSTQTLQYMEEQLIPIVQKKPLNITYDNMGSYSMDDPDGLQEAIVAMATPAHSKITIKGTQGVSLGILESLLWDYARFSAEVSTDWLMARYLNCEDIEGKNCSSAVQGSDKGRCHDTAINRRIWLYCKRPKIGAGENQWQR